MNILKINSSSNKLTSVSREFADKVVDQLVKENSSASVIERDVAYSNIPFVDEQIIDALSAQGERSKEQQQALKLSDELVDELIAADIIVLGAPMYNFCVPASLKAYFDLIARAGRTFKYTDNGPVGLVSGKKAYAVISTGGIELGSDDDFSSKYIKQFLAFIGITDVTLVALDQLMFKAEEKMQNAEAFIGRIKS